MLKFREEATRRCCGSRKIETDNLVLLNFAYRDVKNGRVHLSHYLMYPDITAIGDR
jgi:hypothetical protein